MAALLADLIPAIGLETSDQFLDLRWHMPCIVLRSVGDCLLGCVRNVGPPLRFPERPLPPRAEVPGPFTGDGELMGALVRHAEFDA